MKFICRTLQTLIGAATLGALLFMAGCSGISKNTYADNDRVMQEVGFDGLPQTRSQDWEQALRAFRQSCTVNQSKPLWKAVCEEASYVQAPQTALSFFASNFDVWQVEKARGDRADTGLMTGYYEPMLTGSRTKTAQFRHPIFGVPDDLIEVDLVRLYPQLKGMRLRGKVVGRKLVPYDSRADIMKRKDLEPYVICWVDSAVDAAFLQIQGSGRVLLPDGTFVRVGYSDQNGHPYRALGGWLIRNAGLKPEEMSMQRIRHWVEENPKREQELLNTNPGFVFFEERTGYSDDDGPLGAQGVPLTAQASVAVDRRYWQMGIPMVVSADQDNPDMHWSRPVVAQDTGGAIRGLLRFDYFWGYGPLAGADAGRQKSDARAWVLIPRGHHPSEIWGR